MTGVQTPRAVPSLGATDEPLAKQLGILCTCASPQPSEGLRPGRRPESGPPSTPSLYPQGTGHRVLAERPHRPARRFRREKARKPQPWPQPGRTSASCSHWSRPPAPPRSSAGPPGPIWPCLRWRRGLLGEQRRATVLGAAAVAPRLRGPRFRPPRPGSGRSQRPESARNPRPCAAPPTASRSAPCGGARREPARLGRALGAGSRVAGAGLWEKWCAESDGKRRYPGGRDRVPGEIGAESSGVRGGRLESQGGGGWGEGGPEGRVEELSRPWAPLPNHLLWRIHYYCND